MEGRTLGSSLVYIIQAGRSERAACCVSSWITCNEGGNWWWEGAAHTASVAWDMGEQMGMVTTEMLL